MRPLQLLPFVVVLLAALGALGLPTRRAADALAPSRPPVARPARVPAAPLVFDPPRVPVGALPAGVERRVAVGWRYVGTARRRVLGVDATCGCVVAEGLPPALAPGDEGVLTLAVRAPRREGPFGATVKVWLDPPAAARPPALVVRGHVGRRLRVRPDAVDLGPHTAGREVGQALDLAVVDALADAVVTARLEGLAGDVGVAAPAFAGRPGASLDLRVRVPAAPGPFEGRLVVEVPGEPDLAVPVRGIAVRR